MFSTSALDFAVPFWNALLGLSIKQRIKMGVILMFGNTGSKKKKINQTFLAVTFVIWKKKKKIIAHFFSQEDGNSFVED